MSTDIPPETRLLEAEALLYSDREEAMRIASALEDHPDGPIARHAAVLVTIGLAQSGRLFDAVSRALAVLDDATDVEALRLLNVLGACYDLMEQPERAVACYAQALARAGDDHLEMRRKLQVNRGVALARMDQHVDALACFQVARGLARSPAQSARLELDAALSHLALDQLDRAEQALDAAEAAATQAGHRVTMDFIAHNRARLAAERGRPEQALSLFRAVLDRSPSPALRAATWLEIARLSLGEARIQACRQVLSIEVDSDEHAIPAAALLAAALQERGDLAGALAATQDLHARSEARWTRRHQRSLDVLRVQHQVEALEQRNAALSEANARLVLLNRDKDELLGIIGHDLRSPLTAVMMVAERLQEPLDPGELQSLGHSLMGSGGRMYRLIDQLIDAHRAENDAAAHLALVDLAQVADAVLDSCQALARKKGLALRYDGPRPAMVQSDRGVLEQILANLVDNAIKFSEAGCITLAVEDSTVSVSDQGPGLTADDHARVFGKFERLSARPTAGEPSTGLGLYIVKRQVQRLGGRVWVEDNPGGGARFVVRLPTG